MGTRGQAIPIRAAAPRAQSWCLLGGGQHEQDKMEPTVLSSNPSSATSRLGGLVHRIYLSGPPLPCL